MDLDLTCAPFRRLPNIVSVFNGERDAVMDEGCHLVFNVSMGGCKIIYINGEFSIATLKRRVSKHKRSEDAPSGILFATHFAGICQSQTGTLWQLRFLAAISPDTKA